MLGKDAGGGWCGSGYVGIEKRVNCPKNNKPKSGGLFLVTARPFPEQSSSIAAFSAGRAWLEATIRLMRDTNKFHFSFSRNSFFLQFPLPWWSNELLVESAGGWLSTSKSPCLVPTWALTQITLFSSNVSSNFGERFFGDLCKPVIALSDLGPQEMFTLFGSACKWSLFCVDLSECNSGAIQKGVCFCHKRATGLHSPVPLVHIYCVC